MQQTLKVTRVSTMPNKFQSYAYLIEGELPKSANNSDLEGIYEPRNEDAPQGSKLIYSRSRLGKTNVAFNCPVRVVEFVKDGVATGRFFLNLVDTGLEAIADAGAKYQIAEKFGQGFAAAFAQHAVSKIYGASAAPVAAPAATTGAAADTITQIAGPDPLPADQTGINANAEPAKVGP